MSEDSTTPDLVELTRCAFEAANRRDFDVLMSFFAPDAVWEGAGLGTTFEGLAAIRGFWEDWFASYGELGIEQEEILDLGNGVVFAVLIQKARLVGGVLYRGGAGDGSAVPCWAFFKICRNCDASPLLDDVANDLAGRRGKESPVIRSGLCPPKQLILIPPCPAER